MNDWIAAVQVELGLNVSFDTDAILDAARDAAHATERKAAPITTYLMGVAAAQGAKPQEIAAKIEKLAKSWPSDK
ncbi:MAG: hypothetical protein EBY75_03070 [Actinobacteria bacterium]|jgi:Domain of unknown function (DUF6457)|nr:hypothetical protein [Actinomycetota bacterium]NDA94969.1 hypothetical protein [Actinomycetota bacterium]NDH99599.1 hypothetical protein [Actinomycetota bacterium]NDI07298.1 hypothetical protein [Actinomycetota bacterium]